MKALFLQMLRCVCVGVFSIALRVAQNIEQSFNIVFHINLYDMIDM